MTTIHEPAVDALDVDAPAPKSERHCSVGRCRNNWSLSCVTCDAKLCEQHDRTHECEPPDPDAPAAAQLAKDAGDRAHVIREDGCTYIRFDSRDDFRAACAEGVIQLDNPFMIQVRGADVIAPVLFGHGGQWRWQAEARYPAQRPCDCTAEVVHQLGCSATEYPEQWMFAEPSRIDPDGLDEIPVVVVEVPRGPMHRMAGEKRGSVCGRFVSHVDSLTDRDDQTTCADCLVMLTLPRRTSGAAIVHELLPNEYDGFGGLTCDRPFTGSEPATTVAADVTCPDCLRYIKPTPTLAEQAREHAVRRTALVPPMTRFLRDAYSDVRAAEARDLASVLIEEASGE